MNTYQSKIVTFFSGGNTVIITCDRDLISLRSMAKKVGLICFPTETYWSLLQQYNQYRNGKQNTDFKLGHKFLVEFVNGKGFTTGWNSIKESEDWYGEKPFTIKELLNELKEDK